jgi:secondary thiamine-phosphate synthase enzyme
MVKTYSLSTDRNGLIDITPQVLEALAETGLADGILLVSIPHSTASITVMSPWDPLGLEDVHDEINRIVPTRIDFKHQYDTPQDASAHVKAAIVGHSRSFFFEGGKLGLGHSQKIYFWEFDGPRTRQFQIQVMGK